MTASALLRSTRKLISKPDCFCKQVMARDAKNNEVDARDDAARRWSLDGALLRCADLGSAAGQGDYHQAVQHLRSMAKGKSIADINDLKQHGTILEMLERAARALDVTGRMAA
jgi:hypothetical protein